MKVLFLMNEYLLHNRLVCDYHAARPDDELALIRVPLSGQGKSWFSKSRRVLQSASRRFAFMKVQEAILLRLAGVWSPYWLRLGDIARRLDIPYREITNVHDPEALEFIEQFRPQLVVTLFHQILRAPFFARVRAPIVNIHPGLLPEFKGIQPYFWQLATGAPHSGVSLHFIEDEGVDTGAILARAMYRNRPGMSVQLNYYLTARCAARLLPLVVANLEGHTAAPRAQIPGSGGYYRWPTSQAVDDLLRRACSLSPVAHLVPILRGQYDSFVPEEVEIHIR